MNQRPAWWWDPKLFTVLRLAARAYRSIAEQNRKGGGLGYAGEQRAGVAHVVVFVGTDREAWRISQRAIEEWQRPA